MQSKTIVAILAFCAASALAAPAADVGTLNARGEECQYCEVTDWRPYQLDGVWVPPHSDKYSHEIAYSKHAFTASSEESGHETTHFATRKYPHIHTWLPYWWGGVQYLPNTASYDHDKAYSRKAFVSESSESGRETTHATHTVGKRCEGDCDEDLNIPDFKIPDFDWFPYWNGDKWCVPGTEEYNHDIAWQKHSYTHKVDESGHDRTTFNGRDGW